MQVDVQLSRQNCTTWSSGEPNLNQIRTQKKIFTKFSLSLVDYSKGNYNRDQIVQFTMNHCQTLCTRDEKVQEQIHIVMVMMDKFWVSG